MNGYFRVHKYIILEQILIKSLAESQKKESYGKVF